ncbi:Cytosolic copper metallochaperone [Ascosphaera aggregata]|nr:Cytosolic copper metallochaperone [Ascosphaera aggregata]
MPEHHYNFNVTMACGGCSSAIERVLKKLEGIKCYNVNLGSQTAEITTIDDSLPFEKVLATIRKTGKTVNSAEEDGERREV